MIKQKVMFFSPDKRDSCSYYRSSGVLPFIKHPDFELIDASDTKIWDWTNFIGIKVFLLQRAFTSEHKALIAAAKNMGVKVILDYDDLLTDGAVDMYNPTHKLYRENQGNIIDCLQMADEIWVSTQVIKDEYQQYNKNIVIVSNAHNDFLFPVSKKMPFNPKGKKCFYRGGSSHQADVTHVGEQLVKVINDNKDWTFSFLGDRFTYLELNCGDNYHIIGGVTLFEYFKFVRDENPQAWIFPLVDTKFNRAKSNISWIEATYAGAAFFGNCKLPEFQKPVIIDFSQLEIGLTTNFELLEQYNEMSWQYICDTLLLSNINKLRVERILEIIND